MVKMFQPYHLVTPSPWPILMSFSILNLLVDTADKIDFSLNSMNWLKISLTNFHLLVLLLLIFSWMTDILWENQIYGEHSSFAIKGFKMGMILFIVSEIFFFLSIFWCYFHMFLSPSIQIGGNWPPKNIEMFNPYSIPLLNTIILLSSGVSITWAHYSLLIWKERDCTNGHSYTIILGLLFSFIQYYEYNNASFSIADSVYGSIFFLSTGFHGFHVLVGTILLMFSTWRSSKFHYNPECHFGFELSAWYWHFVDVVWLFLYILVYFWSY